MFELNVAIKKAVIYQLMAMILLFCYTWFWFGEPVSSLSFTVSFALILMVYYVSFEYVWDKEINPMVSNQFSNTNQQQSVQTPSMQTQSVQTTSVQSS